MRSIFLLLAITWLDLSTAGAGDVVLTPAAQALIEPVFQTYARIDADLAALPPPADDSERLRRLKRLDQEPLPSIRKLPSRH